jgi:hypothetical protein
MKRLAPRIVAAVALGWVFHRLDARLIGAALARAPIGKFLAFSVVILACNLAADTFAMWRVFGWFDCRAGYRDLLVVRAATYLLAVINYHVGQAAIVGYLYRAKKIPLLRASGFILFIIGVNVGTLFLLASAGAARAGDEVALLRYLPLVTAIGACVYAVLLVARPRLLAGRALLQPLFEMGVVGHLKGVAVRLPHVFVLIVWYYVSFHLFGIEVTPLAAIVFLPAYFATGSLPISPNGIGIPQVVAIAFFSRYYTPLAGVTNVKAAQDAAVMACCLSAQVVCTITQLLFGLLCLRRATALGIATEETPATALPQAEAG